MFGVPVGQSGNYTVGHMMRHLICEGIGASVVDTDDGEKAYFVEGIFMQGDVMNNNKRVYPTSILETAVQEYEKQKIVPKTAWGELGHPDSPKINLDKVAILVECLTKRGNDFYGRAKVCHEDCPMGKVLRGLLKTGGRVGVSSRGLGSANPASHGGEDCNLVDAFNLRAVDVVADPSAPNAMVEAIYEEKQYILDGSSDTVLELNEETYKLFEDNLKVLPVKEEPKQEQVFEAVKNFLNGLRSND
jgi:hypothetical protein